MKPAFPPDEVAAVPADHLLTANPMLADYDEHRPTDEQVNMQATLPHHMDDHGTNAEDVAGTGEVDTFGG